MNSRVNRNHFLDTAQFGLEVNSQGIVEISMGATQVNLSLDSAYELQYHLAAFLARLELEIYYPRQD